MQNKPNFQNAEIDLTSYAHMDYDHNPPLRTAKKQTQSNPISAQMKFSDSVYIHKMHLGQKWLEFVVAKASNVG